MTTPPLSVQKTEEAYYNLLAGGARYALFTSLCDLYLPAILGSGDKSAEEIIAALGIAAHRGRKWLHALHLAGFLDKLPRPDGGEQVNGLDEPPRYRLGELLRSMFGEGGYGGWFFREFLRYYRTAVAYPLPGLLYGMQLEQPVRYPPVDSADTSLLHDWMRSAAIDTLAVIRRYVDFERYERLLDVGGGDGTMALQLYKSFPRLIITVFNMPQPTDMVRELAEKNNAWDRIGGIAGDFRTDPLPGGNDAVMFSRVLADWPPELCRRLLQKAHKALADDGHLIICEPLYDHNPDLCLVWEHSYVPYDDFGLQCYKPLSLYERLLKETGFELVSVHPPSEETIHCVILARRLDVPVAIDPTSGEPTAPPAPKSAESAEPPDSADSAKSADSAADSEPAAPDAKEAELAEPPMFKAAPTAPAADTDAAPRPEPGTDTPLPAGDDPDAAARPG